MSPKWEGDGWVPDPDEEGYTLAKCPACGMGPAWFSVADLDHACGGSGTLACYCGGDACQCHNHGEVECDGCEECGTDEEDRNGWAE